MAYTSVHVRRAFAKPTPIAPPVNPPPVENSKTQRAAREWPPAVRQYVQRSFAEPNTIAGIGKHEMEKKLKEIITSAAESNTLHTVDWANLPLPQQMIVDERNKMYTMPVAKTSEQLSNLQVHNFDASPPRAHTKKRKSSEQPEKQPAEEKTPPWRNNKTQTSFESRISFPEKRPRIEAPNGTTSKSPANLENRRRRFENPIQGNPPLSPFAPIAKEAAPNFVENGPIVGRCQTLEKRYLRLTAAPNPDIVRPLEVLEKTLALLKQKWKEERNYSYICDQFKSLRQDLTVQHIKTSFTVNVYEIHARIALEKGDLGEYNQCQTQLRALYALNLEGHPLEFKAYRILYFIHTCNRTDMNDVLADLTPAEKNKGPIKHALEARSALALGNYHRFFKLYLETPNMGAYLMDMFVGRERLAALANICKAYVSTRILVDEISLTRRSYKPLVKLRFITEELAFETDEEAARFICDYEADDSLETKEGEVVLACGKAASVFEEAKKAAFRRVDIKGQI